MCHVGCKAFQFLTSSALPVILQPKWGSVIIAPCASKAIITATIALADYFLPSVDDVKVLCGLDQPEAIVDWCHRLGAKHVALKIGVPASTGGNGAM